MPAPDAIAPQKDGPFTGPSTFMNVPLSTNPHDLDGMIAFLAGTFAIEILSLFCNSPTIKQKL